MIRAAHVGSFPRQPKEMPELLRQLLKVLQGRHHRASRLLHQYMAIAAQCDNQNQYQPCCNPKIRSLHTHGMHTHGIVLCFHYYIHCGTQHKTMSISKRRIGWFDRGHRRISLWIGFGPAARPPVYPHISRTRWPGMNQAIFSSSKGELKQGQEPFPGIATVFFKTVKMRMQSTMLTVAAKPEIRR